MEFTREEVLYAMRVVMDYMEQDDDNYLMEKYGINTSSWDIPEILFHKVILKIIDNREIHE